MDNARHENITIKFSNKLPKLKEEDLWAANLEIPEQYKINETPITYKTLVNIFKRTPIPSSAKSFKAKIREPIQTEEDGAPEFEEMVEKFKKQVPHIDEGHQLQPGWTGNDSLEFDEIAVLDHAQAAVTAISDGIRSIIQHIPYNASAALTPANISKDQWEQKETRDIIQKLRTEKIKSKKLK